MSATPRPWRLESFENDHSGYTNILGVLAPEYSALTPLFPKGEMVVRDVEQDDAELIVKCVNAHEKLVEALRNVLGLASVMADAYEETPAQDGFKSIWGYANDALLALREAGVSRRRLLDCIEHWPECREGGYDPRCCRFPKSCSCTVYDDDNVSDEELEPEQVTAIDLDRIEQLAKAATPGPWDYGVLEYYWRPEDGPLYKFSVSKDSERIASIGGADDLAASNNAEYIAYMHPDMTKALVERIRELEAALEGRHYKGCPMVQPAWMIQSAKRYAHPAMYEPGCTCAALGYGNDGDRG